MTKNTYFKIIGIIIVVSILGVIFAEVWHKNSVYTEIKKEITEKTIGLPKVNLNG